MEELDLDSFIANIEQTAPEEVIDQSRPRCQECDIPLEDIDGIYTCPNCSAQATNILEIEETELHYDENGRPFLGQGVMINAPKRSTHEVDYGWTWSTDEAVVHILNLQVSALENAGLVPEFFRKGLSNMWLKFWADNIAPFIRDDYNVEDLIPIQTSKAMKLRDIEVLVKVRDEVMVPAKLANEQNLSRGRKYGMLGTRFYRADQLKSSADSSEAIDTVMQDEDSNPEIDTMDVDEPTTIPPNNQGQTTDLTQASQSGPQPKDLTRTLGKDSVTILTLNRTLAFLEATARCLKHNDPIFASDILRACNCRLIPFFGAHKFLPEGLRLNPRDRVMFQKDRSMSPLQLTRAASLLVHRVYRDRAPFTTPVPSLRSILERFVHDLNLPHELTRLIKIKNGFHSIHQTKPTRFSETKVKYFPQYDRWAFAVLICQMKRLFGLRNDDISKQTYIGQKIRRRTGQNTFILEDWIRQLSIKLKLIMTYDPFVLFHPMASLKDLQTTPQLCKYIETLLSDRPRASTRNEPLETWKDEVFRSDLVDFLRRELPRPSKIELMTDEDLEQTTDIKHPITDAFKRTKRFWLPNFREHRSIVDLLFRDFSCAKLVIPEGIERWEINAGGSIKNMKFEMSPEWPYCYKLLLSLGGYVCYCEPRELLREVRFIEEILYGTRKRAKRRIRCTTYQLIEDPASQSDQ